MSAWRGGPAFAEILRKKEELSRDARGVGLLRRHSSLRSVPLLLGHFRADGNKAVEEEGMARETRALLGRWQQFGRGGPAFAEILRKSVFRVSLGDRLRK